MGKDIYSSETNDNFIYDTVQDHGSISGATMWKNSGGLTGGQMECKEVARPRDWSYEHFGIS